MEDINMIDSCQVHLYEQYASNIKRAEVFMIPWTFQKLNLFLKEWFLCSKSQISWTGSYIALDSFLIFSGIMVRYMKQGFFFSILGRDPSAFQIGKISVVNLLIGKFVIVHNYVIFGQ